MCLSYIYNSVPNNSVLTRRQPPRRLHARAAVGSSLLARRRRRPRLLRALAVASSRCLLAGEGLPAACLLTGDGLSGCCLLAGEGLPASCCVSRDGSLRLGGSSTDKMREELRMCSVLEPRGTEWNHSIPRAWNGSDPVFGSENFEERNGSIFCSVGSKMEERNGIFLVQLTSFMHMVNIPPVSSIRAIKISAALPLYL